jgi:hypothetical protein
MARKQKGRPSNRSELILVGSEINQRYCELGGKRGLLESAIADTMAKRGITRSKAFRALKWFRNAS